MAEVISIHAPARGATEIITERDTRKKFQSTLPQGERRGLTLVVFAQDGISIHAPARGATKFNSGRSRGKVISIHAPARGATRVQQSG